MKLLIRKLWFPHCIDETINALFRIPQMQEQFDEGFEYNGEMRPRGLKIFSGYWPADAILDKLPDSEKEVYLILTSMELKGDYGRIHGKGRNKRAIASSDGFTNGYGVFNSDDPHFNAMAFGEIGHALGLTHHDFDPSNKCEMSHNNIPGPRWSSLDEIRFCNDCYQKIK
ncbi:hypothetical protein HY636_05445 [Candidatus Woesearchaeota archaeon]|nr:hypothetical protein [Candidatus Woesearchaeota archaeon]